ncbi:MAG: hypothetical protein HYV09_40930 [Deltaproteobacteria bacterium]|nr:hypothetical protein [Deltaproteobacteria bacterium]
MLPLELAGVFTAEIGWLAKRDAPANEVLPYGAPVVVAMPLVHALYGNGKTALASLGLRTALYGGAFAAFQADVSCSRGESLCIPLWSIMALTAAATISSIVDLKWAYVDEPHAAWRKLPVIPSVQPTGHGGTFALTAIF